MVVGVNLGPHAVPAAGGAGVIPAAEHSAAGRGSRRQRQRRLAIGAVVPARQAQQQAAGAPALASHLCRGSGSLTVQACEQMSQLQPWHRAGAARAASSGGALACCSQGHLCVSSGPDAIGQSCSCLQAIAVHCAEPVQGRQRLPQCCAVSIPLDAH